MFRKISAIGYSSIILLFMIASCNSYKATEAEVKAVGKVLDFYGGVCDRNKGFVSKNGVTQTYFELEMSGSKLLESYSEQLEMPASNIAFIFYTNLGAEQKNYTHVKVTIHLSNNKTSEYYYSGKDLVEIGKYIPMLETVTKGLSDRNYSAIISEFDPDIAASLSVTDLEKLEAPFDSAYGSVKEMQFQGFAYFNAEKSGQQMVHIAGALIRERGNTPISLFLNRQSGKINTMNYKF